MVLLEELSARIKIQQKKEMGSVQFSSAGKRPGCFYGGTVVKSGKTGFAISREGKVTEQYSVIVR